MQIGIFLAVLSNLTFTPAILFMFPRFWTGAAYTTKHTTSLRCCGSTRKTEYVPLTSTFDEQDGMDAVDVVVCHV